MWEDNKVGCHLLKNILNKMSLVKKGKHLQTLNNAKRRMIRQVGPLLYKKNKF